MDTIRTEVRHGQLYDPDDRTTRDLDVKIDTFPEPYVIDSNNRNKINHDIAGFVLGGEPRNPEVEELIQSKKFRHNEGSHSMEIVYGDLQGNHVIESRPDNVSGSMGRLISVRYITQGPRQGPPKAA